MSNSNSYDSTTNSNSNRNLNNAAKLRRLKVHVKKTCKISTDPKIRANKGMTRKNSKMPLNMKYKTFKFLRALLGELSKGPKHHAVCKYKTKRGLKIPKKTSYYIRSNPKKNPWNK